jgi:hypothetical protein
MLPNATISAEQATTLARQAGGEAAPLQSGTQLPAKVQAMLQNSLARVLTASGTFDVQTPAPLAKGTPVLLDVVRVPQGAKVVLAPESLPPNVAAKLPPGSGQSLPLQGPQTTAQALAQQSKTALQQSAVAMNGTTAQIQPEAQTQTVQPARQNMAVIQPATLKAGQIVQGTVLAQTGPQSLQVATPQGRFEIPFDPKSAQPAVNTPIRLEVMKLPDGLALRPLGQTVQPQTQQTAPRPALTPQQQAVQNAIRDAAGKQLSAPVALTALSSIIQNQSFEGLPKPAQDAISQILGQRLNASQPLDAKGLQQALQQSGISTEARLARAAQPAQDFVPLHSQAQPQNLQGTQPLPLPSGTLKTALMQLAKNLAQSFGKGAGPMAGSGAPLVPDAAPPTKSGLPQAIQSQTPHSTGGEALNADAMSEADMGRTLQRVAEGMLARLKLLQAASMPVETARGDMPQRADGTAPFSMSFEIPLQFGQSQSAIAFQVEDEGSNSDIGDARSGWRLRFALDLEPTGPLHSLVTLKDSRLGVSLWSENKETVAEFEDAKIQLESTLRELGFDIETVRIIHGKPIASMQDKRAGLFLDTNS